MVYSSGDTTVCCRQISLKIKSQENNKMTWLAVAKSQQLGVLQLAKVECLCFICQLHERAILKHHRYYCLWVCVHRCIDFKNGTCLSSLVVLIARSCATAKMTGQGLSIFSLKRLCDKRSHMSLVQLLFQSLLFIKR